VFGWDASDYDWSRGPMDLAAARADGIDFFTHKATEATSITHVHYRDGLLRARDAGIPVLAAYHVVRSPANARDEVDFHLNYVDRQTPWWRDWPHWCWQVDLEKWPYDDVPAAEGEDFADIIETLTGRPAFIYASRGQYGDALRGTSHPLWNASYGTNPAVHYRAAYPGDGSTRWAAYSGRVPAILQYGSRTTIGRQPTCDANAFRGTLADLLTLTTNDGDDMPLSNDDVQKIWTWDLVNGPDIGMAYVLVTQLVADVKELKAMLAQPPVSFTDAQLADLADRLAAILKPQLTAVHEDVVNRTELVVKPPAGG